MTQPNDERPSDEAVKLSWDLEQLDVARDDPRIIARAHALDAFARRCAEHVAGPLWTIISNISGPIRKCFRDRTMMFADFQREALQWEQNISGEHHPDCAGWMSPTDVAALQQRAEQAEKELERAKAELKFSRDEIDSIRRMQAALAAHPQPAPSETPPAPKGV